MMMLTVTAKKWQALGGQAEGWSGGSDSHRRVRPCSRLSPVCRSRRSHQVMRRRLPAGRARRVGDRVSAGLCRNGQPAVGRGKV